MIERILVYMALLTLIYILTLGTYDPWDALIGALVAAAVLVANRRFLFGDRVLPLRHLARRVVGFVPFSAVTVWDVTVGTWRVILIVLGLRRLTRPGIVAIPIGDRTPNGMVATTLAKTLSPGSLLVDVDAERGVMLFHILEVDDPDRVRAEYEEFYRRYQRSVFP
ncbi:MAG: Na+/H+ antiporter subunit E [Chloroflexota bacterium]